MPLISIYGLSLVSSVIAALSLSSIGCHLAARDKSMQTLCLGQGATLGVLLGLGMIPLFTESDLALHIGPFFTAFLVSSLTFLIAERIARGKMSSRNSYYTTLFTTLLSLGYLVSASFPALESHLAQIFFGDLATLNNQDAVILLVLSGTSLAVLGFFWRSLTNQSFEVAVFGESFSRFRHHRTGWLFNAVALVTLCFSVQFAGFLFTIAALFLPTVLLRSIGSSVRAHLLACPLLAGLGTLTGFLLSLKYSTLPTVPTIVLAILTLGFIYRIFVPRGRTGV